MAKPGGTTLPVSRIKTIMKSSPDVTCISQESLYLITRATEVFIQDLAKRSLRASKDPKAVEYNDLAKLVDKEETLQFLQDIIPSKITMNEYHELLQKETAGEDGVNS